MGTMRAILVIPVSTPHPKAAVPVGALALLALWIVLPGSVPAASHRPESFVLPNGLRVIVQNDPSSALVALQMWVEAGSAQEAPEEAGVAHVLEHVIFRGSSEPGNGKLASEVENLGGTINGYTAHDRTVYHMVLPAFQLQSGLRLLSQMMHLPSLGHAELRKEVQVVLEEWKQGQDNSRARVSRELFKTAYHRHPYGQPVIGTPENLSGITWEMVTRFYHRWYTAENMTLVVAGNATTDQVRKELAEHFASLPSGRAFTRGRLQQPLQTEPRITIVHAPVRQAHLMLGFPIPRASEPEGPGLDFLAFILGRGESSRLAQKVKIAEGHVNSISASTFTPKGPGLFLIQAQLEVEKTQEALKAILKEVFRLREAEVSPAELSRAHVNFVRTFVESRETVQGQASQIGRFQALFGDPNYEQTYLEAIRRVDVEKLKSLARTFFRTDRLSVSLLLPENSESPKPEEIAGLSRSLDGSPALAAQRENGILKTTLPNGLKILIREDRRLPLFTVHAGVIGGLLLENETNNGIHNFIAAMLTQGNPRRSSAELVHEVEQLGGMLNGSAGNYTLSLTGTFPSQHVEKGLKIFLETLLHPIFPESELEKKRQEILARIKNRDERPRAQAFRLFYRTLLRHHPYRLHPAGEREAVLGFRREDLAAHYQALISPERMVLTVVGDVDGETLLKQLRSELSTLSPTPSSRSLPSAEAELSEQRVEKKTGKFKQAHLVLGYPGPAKGEADYFALKVLEVILSRIGGRLFVELRDRQGLAYSVGAFSLDDPFQGAFGILAATDPENIEKIKDGIVREIQRLREEECTEAELARAKNYLIGNYLIARQTNAAKAADLTANELVGFGPEFPERYREGIEKVSAGDILRVARQYLALDRYVLAIVGP